MSSYQLRARQLIYSATSELFSDGTNGFYIAEYRANVQLFLPHQVYVIAMDFTRRERDNLQMLHHFLDGLSADGLIRSEWEFGKPEVLRTLRDNVPGGGPVYSPSLKGVESLLCGPLDMATKNSTFRLPGVSRFESRKFPIEFQWS